MSRSLGGRLCLWVLVMLGVTAGSSVSAARPADVSAHAAVACSEPYNYPKINYPYLDAVAAFRCRTGAPHAEATLVLQGFEHGKWTKIESASLTVRALPGRKYVLRTKPIHCSSTPHHLKVRTDFKLVAGPLTLHPPPSDPLPTYCI